VRVSLNHHSDETLWKKFEVSPTTTRFFNYFLDVGGFFKFLVDLYNKAYIVMKSTIVVD
jgi:hypothetical protein